MLSLLKNIVLTCFYSLQVCSGSDNNFMVINQKDIDPPPLHLQARVGVTNSDLSLHDGSALTFNLDLFSGSNLVKNVRPGVTSCPRSATWANACMYGL